MRRNCKLTVIMGIYNCADTLPEALDSLIEQTYKDFCVVLCDDASTDSTFDVAKSYADRYDNFILIRNEKNLKLAATLNHCLLYADSTYIARMDGDDISLSKRFEKQITFLDNHPEYALVSTPMIHFDEKGNWGIGRATEKPTRLDFRFSTPFAHAATMMRTRVIKEVGGYTDEHFTVRTEDYFLWYKIYKKGYKGYNLQEPLYKMRDDVKALNRRTMQNWYNESRIKFMVLTDLQIPYAFFFATFPLIKSLIPKFLMITIRKRKLQSEKFRSFE